MRNMLARDLHQLRGSNPHTLLCVKEGDISNVCQFD